MHVDGNQVELFVEGESLGRWSLVDVRAERLVSSAFSLKLDDEEVTFIADQPTEFAYGGVEAMANVWAKHRSMRLPLRVLANSRSRQGTKPSRIPDLREAIEETLAGTSSTALDPVRQPARREAAGIASLREATGKRTPDTEPSPSDDAVTSDEAPAVEPEAQPVPAEPAPTAPAGTEIPADIDPEGTPEEGDPIPDSPDTPDAVLAEPEAEQSPPPATDSVFKQSVPWATDKVAEAEADPVRQVSAPRAAEPDDPGPAVDESPAPDEPEEDSEPEVTGRPDQAPESAVAQSGSVPWLAPPPDDPPEESVRKSPEPLTGDTHEVETVSEPEYVVDLGAFEDAESGDRRDDDPGGGDEDAVAAPTEDEDAEDASLPMATSAAKGGIMGAVRSAFVRNRVAHSHVYVEAPGGLGIKRQICAECGHISIGVE